MSDAKIQCHLTGHDLIYWTSACSSFVTICIMREFYGFTYKNWWCDDEKIRASVN